MNYLQTLFAQKSWANHELFNALAAIPDDAHAEAITTAIRMATSSAWHAMRPKSDSSPLPRACFAARQLVPQLHDLFDCSLGRMGSFSGQALVENQS